MTMAISKAVEERGAGGDVRLDRQYLGIGRGLWRARRAAVYVLIPAGKIALGKLSQAMMHQATVIQIEGNFDQAL